MNSVTEESFPTTIIDSGVICEEIRKECYIREGFTDLTQLQLPLFLLFFMNCMVTVVGNLSLINLIYLNAHLHTPMYFFIFNLSFIDLCHSLVITPKLLMSFVSENTISFEGCMAQLFFFCFFVHSECYVLTAMAYDRYVAICKPLLYTMAMSPVWTMAPANPIAYEPNMSREQT